MAELIVYYSGASTPVVPANDNTWYSSLADLVAAGKTAFPNAGDPGAYPASVVVTSVAAGGGPGSEVDVRTNVEDPLPTLGFPVHGSGQQFVIPGFSPVSRNLISNVCIVDKANTDVIYLSSHPF